jgi:acyl-CoA reductase-like NAD-dependent aldehyde dehydrogenase
MASHICRPERQGRCDRTTVQSLKSIARQVLAGIVNINSPTVNDETHAPMGGFRDSGWGRTGPDSLKEFQDVIWINSHSGQRSYPF